MKRLSGKIKTRLIAGIVIVSALAAVFFLGEPLPSENAESVILPAVPTETIDNEYSLRSEIKSESVLSKQTCSETVSSEPSEDSATDKEMCTEGSSLSSETLSEIQSSSASDDTDNETEISFSQQPDESTSDNIIFYDEHDESTAPSGYKEDEGTENSSAAASEVSTDENSSAAQYYCTITINCTNALNYDGLSEYVREILPKDGDILKEISVAFEDGDSPFTLLQNACRDNGIPLEYSLIPFTGGAYIEGIYNLYELDCGSLSGWMYSVNGEFPSVSCSDIKLSEGDRVEFLYTCDLGEDVGNHYRGD